MQDTSRTIIQSATPSAIPLSYLSFFDFFSDPMKIAGLIVLVLQGIYILIQIRKSLRSKNEPTNEP